MAKIYSLISKHMQFLGRICQKTKLKESLLYHKVILKRTYAILIYDSWTFNLTGKYNKMLYNSYSRQLLAT